VFCGHKQCAFNDAYYLISTLVSMLRSIHRHRFNPRRFRSFQTTSARDEFLISASPSISRRFLLGQTTFNTLSVAVVPQTSFQDLPSFPRQYGGLLRRRESAVRRPSSVARARKVRHCLVVVRRSSFVVRRSSFVAASAVSCTRTTSTSRVSAVYITLRDYAQCV